MIAAIRDLLTRAVPSWTVWLGIVWAVVSGLPDVLTTVVGWFGPVTPELTAQVVAFSLVVARLRSIAAPIVAALLAKE